MTAHDEEKKRAFDKWVIVPASWAAVSSVVAATFIGFFSKGLFDAASGRVPFRVVDLVAIVVALLAGISSFAAVWRSEHRKEHDG